MRLWYQQPAKSWTEALPIGNGRLGAMIYGRVDREVISLNEDTLWSGYPKDMNPQNKSEYYRKATNLAINKKYHEAQKLLETELTSSWGQSYMPLGDILLDFKHPRGTVDYTRDLDISAAVATVKYNIDGTEFKREMFASAPDNVIVIKVSSNKPKSISFSLTFDSQLKSEVTTRDGFLVLKGEAPSHVEPSYSNDLEESVLYSKKDEERGMLFAAMSCVRVSGGTVRFEKTKITVENADASVIIVNAQTSFAGYDVLPYLNGKEYKNLCMDGLKDAAGKSYEALLSTHIADYKEYFDRVSLKLGSNETSELPTDKRLYRFTEEQNDLELYTLLFQYGRYLLVSSSRQKTQPANLQGIWNSELRPPWSSNYTININTQMNYWPVFSCALGEFQEPLVQLIRELSVAGRATARELYGAKGFTSHHNTDLWRFSSPVGNHRKGSACFAFWNISAGWLCRHLFDQYEYTLDRDFLVNTAHPIMKSAAEFLLDILTEDAAGYLIVCPSTSPENTFIYEGERCNISATTTMTMTVVKELFNNCIRSCEILDCDMDFANELKEKLVRLYPYKTGSRGQLLEGA